MRQGESHRLNFNNLHWLSPFFRNGGYKLLGGGCGQWEESGLSKPTTNLGFVPNEAQTGAGGEGYSAIVNIWGLDEVIEVLLRGVDVAFNDETICYSTDAVSTDVWSAVGSHGKMVGGGKGSNFEPFCEAATGARISLDDINGFGFDEVTEPPARELVFTTSDRDIESRAEEGLATKIICRGGLLIPVRIIALDHAGETQGSVGIPSIVDVDHELDVGADGATDGVNAFGIMAETSTGPADLHLHGAIAMGEKAFHLGDELADTFICGIVTTSSIDGDVLAVTTHEFPARLIEGFTAEVPQGDIDNADSRDHIALSNRLAIESVEPVPAGFGVEWVLIKKQ